MRPLHLALSAAAAASSATAPVAADAPADPYAGAVCSPPDFECWDGSTVHARPPDCEFACPPCPAPETHTCPDGSVVRRDAMKGCNFKPCAQKKCDDDTFACPDSGRVMGRDPDNFCEFFECPATCPGDFLTCEDGSRVYRNPLHKCQFDPCGGLQHCRPDVFECPDGMGYVFRNEKNNCEFFPCTLATASLDGDVGAAGKNDWKRRADIFSRIGESKASEQRTMFVLSPQSVALDWLATADPARLDTAHPALLQRYALAVFYFSTFTYEHLSQIDLLSDEPWPGHGWDDESGWLTGKGHCAWYGVQCRPRVEYDENGEPHLITVYDDSDSVTHLNLTNNMVRGVLPREFNVFEDLRVLDLSQNIIGGPIPSNGWAGMTNLTVLALQVNKLVGPIPLQLFNFRKLQVLNLEYNWLTGEIPNYWHMLGGLRQVRLGLNEFNSTIPNQFGALSDLRVLWLDANDLTGTIPDTIQFLANCQSLFLHRNGLTGPIPPAIRRMTELKELTVAENELTGTIPSEFGSMENLYSLYLENNHFVGPIPPQLGQLDNLVVLRIFNNDIRDDIEKSSPLCKLRNSPRSQLIWLAADCAVPHEAVGGETEVFCACCDECHGGYGDDAYAQ